MHSLMHRDRILSILLVILIAVGILLRLIGLSGEYLWDDEQPNLIAEMKFHHQSFQDGALYFQEHPPLGKWFLGLPSIVISANYAPLRFLGSNMFVYKYIPYEALAENYGIIRLWNALIGCSALLFVFLIVRSFFGTSSALWSTLLMALSADFILMSRHDNLLKMGTIFFGLGCLYFYLKYIRSPDVHWRAFYLGCTLLFLMFALGSRNYDPLFLLPTLIISQFVLCRGKKYILENLIVTTSIILTCLLVFNYYYPAEAQTFAKEHLEVSSPLNLLGFGLLGIFKNMFIRNSYMYSIAAILVLFCIFYYILFFKKRNPIFNHSVHDLIQQRNPVLVLIIFFLITFLGISFSQSRFGYGLTYNVMLFAATMLLGGPIIHHMIEKWHNLRWFFILLFGINTIQFMFYFPYGLWEYSNLGQSYPYYSPTYDHNLVDQQLHDLAAIGNPMLLTDSVNILLFYPGAHMPLPPVKADTCSSQYFEQFKSQNVYVLSRLGDLTTSPYVCSLFKETVIEKIKTYDIPVEGTKPTLYKF